ncbi:hypothetical protein HQ571_02265 [Candidatus Kuenenbacteria bacterium]|nr:hypothetical protein [Candidatus Kuenenbacteria bacterium]
MAVITRFGMEIAINTHLAGNRLHNLLIQVVPQLKVDEEGNIRPEQVANIRKTLRAAMPHAPDDATKIKCQKLLEFLEQY